VGLLAAVFFLVGLLHAILRSRWAQKSTGRDGGTEGERDGDVPLPPFVIVDAGSTASRVYAFVVETGGDGRVEIEMKTLGDKFKAPLSKYKELSSLFLKGVSTALEELESEGFEPPFDVRILATQGVRDLPESEQSSIFEMVSRDMKGVKRVGNVVEVRVLTGAEEALGSFSSMRYVFRGDENYTGVMDLGGGSAQISLADCQTCPPASFSVPFFGANSVAKHLRTLLGIQDNEWGPCGLPTNSVTCRAAIRDTIHSLCSTSDACPSVDGSNFRGRLVMVSAGFYAPDYARFVDSSLFPHFPFVSPIELERAAEKICASETASLVEVGSHPFTPVGLVERRCLDLCLLVELVEHFGIPRETQLEVFLEREGKQVEWPLGYALGLVESKPE